MDEIAVWLPGTTEMLQGVVVLVVSTKLITEGAVKCVQVLPVMATGTVTPEDPAPGDTTETAAGGSVVIAEPVSAAEMGEAPGAAVPFTAELAIVSEPARMDGVAEVGKKVT